MTSNIVNDYVRLFVILITQPAIIEGVLYLCRAQAFNEYNSSLKHQGRDPDRNVDETAIFALSTTNPFLVEVLLVLYRRFMIRSVLASRSCRAYAALCHPC